MQRLTHVFVPAWMSVRRGKFLVVSQNDSQCRGSFPTKEEAEAHAAKKIIKALAGGSELFVVAKANTTARD